MLRTMPSIVISEVIVCLFLLLSYKSHLAELKKNHPKLSHKRK